MMASITRVCARKPRIAEFLNRLLLLVALLVFSPANAEEAAVAYADIRLTEEGYVLNADFDFELSPKLSDALENGVTLRFVAELRVEHPRWYWFDKLMLHRRLEYRLSYHAMTRNYRLSIGSLHWSFSDLEDAVYAMRRIRNLYIAPANAFDDKTPYDVELRFLHDTAQLPKLFQLSAMANGEWGVDTGWLEWKFIPETAASE
jgi:hypothetical protein